MKIYTKTGDAGQTGLFAGPRVPKNHPRIEAAGAVDELNAVLGLARGYAPLPAGMNPAARSDSQAALLARIQHALFDLGAELATPDPKSRGTNLVTPAHIEELERAIDHFDAALPPLKTFILPGGTPLTAWLHLARTTCRRAERRVVTLIESLSASATDVDQTMATAPSPSPLPEGEGSSISPHILIYLNRLSDLLFVLARFANHAAGQPDVEWQSGQK